MDRDSNKRDSTPPSVDVPMIACEADTYGRFTGAFTPSSVPDTYFAGSYHGIPWDRRIAVHQRLRCAWNIA